MSRQKILPDDVRAVCIQLVRGYDRRVREYYDRRRDVIDGTACRYETIKDEKTGKYIRVYQTAAHNASRVAENMGDRLLAIESLEETRRMRAVEQAAVQVGANLPEPLRKKLADAVVLNCRGGRRFPFKVLDVDGISERSFYRAREVFLMDIAKYLGLI